MRRTLCVAILSITWCSLVFAEEMPRPDYMKKSYPYTYTIGDDGKIDVESLCQNAPPHEWKTCRIKARWDFTSVCQHLAYLEGHQTGLALKEVRRSKAFYCEARELVPVPAY